MGAGQIYLPVLDFPTALPVLAALSESRYHCSMTPLRIKKHLATLRLGWIVSVLILAVFGFSVSIQSCSPVPNLSSPTATVVEVTATADVSSTANAAVRVDSSAPASTLTPSVSQSLPSPSPAATDTPFDPATTTPTTPFTLSPSSTPFLYTPAVDPTPIAITATPSPQPPVTFVWNEAQATRLAAERVALEGLPISNVNVTLRSGTLRLTGNVALLFSSSPVTVEATPRVEEGQLRFTVTTIAMSGLDVSGWRATVEAAITNTFAGILSGYDVQSYTLQDGELRVQAIRR